MQPVEAVVAELLLALAAQQAAASEGTKPRLRVALGLGGTVTRACRKRAAEG